MKPALPFSSDHDLQSQGHLVNRVTSRRAPRLYYLSNASQRSGQLVRVLDVRLAFGGALVRSHFMAQASRWPITPSSSATLRNFPRCPAR